MKSLKKENIEDIVSLTSLQEGLLFHYLNNPKDSCYLEQLCLEMTGHAEIETIKKAWNLVTETNEMLRVCFRWEKVKKPVQILLKQHRVSIIFHDFSDLDARQAVEKTGAVQKKDRQNQFDLQRVPFRITICKLPGNRSRMIISNHHILYDGWSSGILLKEFFDIYDNLYHKKEPVKPVKTPFKKYLETIQRSDTAAQEKYWRNYLDGIPGRSTLSIKNRAQDHTTGEREKKQDTVECGFNPDETGGIESFLQTFKLTLAPLFYSAWGLLLQKYGTSRGAILGTTVSGRSARLKGMENMVGLFINTLPLWITGQPGDSLLNLLNDVSLVLKERENFETTPLVQIRKYSPVDNQEELFDTIVVIENYPLDRKLKENRGELRVQSFYSYERTNYDLTVSIDTGSEIRVGLGYNRDSLDTASVERMARQYRRLVRYIIRHPHHKLSRIEILSAEEKQDILDTFNSDAGQPRFPFIQDQIESQTGKTPHRVALVYENLHLTYEFVDKEANRVFGELRKCGAGPEVIVGIIGPFSTQMAIGEIAILKAKGAFLPVNPDYPEKRIRYMLRDSGASLLIKAFPDGLLREYENIGITRIVPVSRGISLSFVEIGGPVPATGTKTMPGGDSLAYVLYTSGSTGKPKGVMINHSSITNLLNWFGALRRLQPRTRVLQLTDYTFDPAIEDIFATLANGATLYNIPRDTLLDMDRLRYFIRRQDIQLVNCVPTLLENLLCEGEKLNSLQTVISGGDRLDNKLKDKILRRGYRLFNHYGLIETTVDTHTAHCTLTGGANIFNVKPGVGSYVLDHENRLMPYLAVGEICITGHQVGRGYLNKPELTHDRYGRDPLIKGNRMMRTGDLGIMIPGGLTQVLNRIDDQLKIRGFRVSPGEIENQACQHPGIEQVVVTGREYNPGNKELCAYIVLKEKTADAPQRRETIEGLREHLRGRLPDYMIPRYIQTVESIPLTPLGKIDRRALPEPEITGNTGNYDAPRNNIEEKLVLIWETVLGIKKGHVSVNDNFFDLGGDSILSIQIVSKARQENIRLTPGQLFNYPTIRDLARSGIETIHELPHTGPATGEIPLTPVQRWFFNREFKEKNHWNQSVMLETTSPLEKELLASCFKELINHHDSLRLRFKKKEGEWVQYYSPPVESFEPGHADLSQLRDTAGAMQRSLDITNGPVINAVYLSSESGENNRLFIVIHHLVVDGYSWRIIIEDLQNLYMSRLKQENRSSRANTYQLPAKSISYQEWSFYLQEAAASPSTRHALSYWQKTLPHRPSPFPLDYPRGDNTEESARIHWEIIPPDQTRVLLHEIHRVYRTQVEDILLAALVMCLRQLPEGREKERTAAPGSNETEHSKQGFNLLPAVDRIILDMDGHGRESNELDTSRTTGWFTSIFPFVIDCKKKNQPIDALIKETKENLRETKKWGFAYGLLRYLSPDPRVREMLEKKPRASMSFNYLGQFDQVLQESSLFKPGGETSAPRQGPANTREHLIDFDAMIVGRELKIQWKYSVNLHHPEFIRDLAQRFNQSLHSISEYLRASLYRGYTPSDFSFTRLPQETLDRLAAQYPGSIEDIYPLLPVQESMIFHYLYSPESSVTIEQLVFKIKSKLNIDAFQSAWETLLNRHPSLRTSFLWEGPPAPIQIVHQHLRLPFIYRDWQNLPDDQHERALKEYLEKDRQEKFRLHEPPLTRITVIQTASSSYYVTWTHHHIQVDGWCQGILLEELGALYRAALNGEDGPLPPPAPYKEYIRWLAGRDMEEAENYWRETLKGFTTPVMLSKSLPQTPRGDSASESAPHFGTVKKELPQTSKDHLDTLSREHHVTLNTLVLAAWSLILNRCTGYEDIVFGTTHSGRPAELEDSVSLVGCFMNSLPLRVNVHPNLSLRGMLRQIQDAHVRLRRFETTPLTRVRQWSELPRDSALYDLYESIVIIENYPFDPSILEGLGGLNVEFVKIEEQLDYPLTLYCNVHPRLQFNLLFHPAHFTPEAVRRIMGHLLNIIASMALAGPDTPQEQLTMLSAAERAQIIRGWNDTAMEYPREKCFHHLFEDQAEKSPHHTAVIQGGDRISFQQLDEVSGRLANRLNEYGAGPGNIVGMCVPRSIKMIVSILAILKAGGAFIPIDADYPLHRIAMMVKDAQSPVLILGGSLNKEKIQSHQNLDINENTILYIDREWNRIMGADAAPDGSTKPRDPAYIIFTSGTTGRPKGVVISHQVVVSHCFDIKRRYSLTPADHVLQFTSISFDISLEQVLTTLGGGSTLVLREKEIWGPAEFFQKCEEYKLTVTNLPTSYWHQVVKEAAGRTGWKPPASLRVVVVGGEPMLPRHVELWRKSPMASITLLNACGPAEVAMTSNLFPIPPADQPLPDAHHTPVGKILANRRLYILDPMMNPAPIGVTGEIYIGGHSIASGYLNRPGLTAEKFIKDPYYHAPNQRLYRTGDMGRYLEDGSVTIIGRKDEQIKIRGHRIEPGEIETLLSGHKDVYQAAVAARQHQPGEYNLTAYIVPGDPGTYRTAAIQDFLHNKLPAYMLPSYFVTLEKMPLTPNGKIDRKALEKISVENEPGEEIVPPRTNLEKQLVKICREILGVKRMGITCDFFRLGGHSLRAMNLASRVRQEYRVEFPLRDVFNQPTIAALARIIENARKQNLRRVEPVEKKEYYPLSSAQKRLYFLYRMEGSSTAYNIGYLLKITGPLNIQRCREAFQNLVNRHESLRTSFIGINPVKTAPRNHGPANESPAAQRVHESREMLFTLETFNTDASRFNEAEILDIRSRFVRPFDLEKAPLFRAAAAAFNPDQHLLLVDMHHIVSDGTSIGIMVDEFIRLYTGETLAPVAFRYRDFTHWQRRRAGNGEIKDQETYWLNCFAHGIPTLELPIDKPRPRFFNYKGANHRFTLEPETADNLRRHMKQQGTTPFITLLAALNVLCYRYTGQDDIVIGTTAADRPHSSLRQVIGMFVNKLPIRCQPGGRKSWGRFLGETRELSLLAFENQDMQFEELIEKLNPPRDTSRTALFNVSLVYQNFEMPRLEIQGLHLDPYPLENKTAKFDITLYAFENEDRFSFNIEYYTEIFNHRTVKRMASHFLNILRGVDRHPDTLIGDIGMLDSHERHQLLEEFNRTRTPFSLYDTITDGIAARVRQQPHRVAVVYRSRHLTYRQLDQMAHNLAAYLHAVYAVHGNLPGRSAGILLDPSIHLPAALLGVLKSGCPFVPMEPDAPPERLKYIINDASLRIMVSAKKYGPLLNRLSEECRPGSRKAFEIYFMDEPQTVSYPGAGAGRFPVSSHRHQALAYIIYTSGTTGKSRGVLVTNRNLFNYARWFCEAAQLTHRDHSLLTSSYAFDLGYTSIFPALTAGGTVHIVNMRTYIDPESLLSHIDRFNITYLKITPSLLNILVNNHYFTHFNLPALRLVVLGGEAISAGDIQTMHRGVPHVGFMNHYGPTEATIGCIAQCIDTRQLDVYERAPLIGFPIHNMKAYVLDKDFTPVPIGVPGELHVSGQGIAQGYLNRVELTNQKFQFPGYLKKGPPKDTPPEMTEKTLSQTREVNQTLLPGAQGGGFPEKGPPAGRRQAAYRTGDLVRRHENGGLEFLGRIDHQIKIRGYRVEPGEIESALLKEANIRDAIVIPVKNRQGQNDLCAYVVPSGAVEIGRVRQALSAVLPGYMLPSHIIPLETLPLTPNGKINRKALPEVAPGTQGRQNTVPPRSEVEKTVAQIWSKELGIDTIGIDEDFFLLGGHSLKATIVVSHIHNRTGVKIPLSVLFDTPTIAGMSAYIEKQALNGQTGITNHVPGFKKVKRRVIERG